MIKTLEDAIARIEKLPEAEQEAVARFVLHELNENDAWRQSSQAHQKPLERLVAEIMAEDVRGECPELDVNDL
jgi:aspartate/glutamate racemase